MRLFFALILLLVASGSLLSQSYIGQNRKKVKKRLEQYVSSVPDYTGTFREAGDSITLSMQTTDVTPTLFVYRFDKSGKCSSEKVIANCDSCFTKFLQAALSQKEYKWKKINETQYVSDYQKKLLLEVPPENTNFSFQILKLGWSKEQYKMMTGN